MANPVEVMAEAIFTKWAELEGSDMTWAETLATRFRPGEFPKMAKIVPMARAEARSALSALDAAGFAVVPKEPTPEMRMAGFDACEIQPGTGGYVTGTSSRDAIYRAMLSAAQVKPMEADGNKPS